LFARNIDNPVQVAALVSDLRKCVGRDSAPVLIDQEGGRVARLRLPHWDELPAFSQIGDIAREGNYMLAVEAVKIHARLIADMLSGIGITVNCSPVLDVSNPCTHDVIGNRSFGDDPFLVGRLGYSYAESLMNCGITPVIKHIPGHGRAGCDSHFELPRVDTDKSLLSNTDFYPFHAVSDCMGREVWGMTAHVLFEKLDDKNPVTTSPIVIKEIIRGEIGFDGFLIGDDLSMKALAGTMTDKTLACLKAGCDAVLHCNGKMNEMKEIAAAALPLSDISFERYASAERARLACKNKVPLSAGEKEALHGRLSCLIRHDKFCKWPTAVHTFLDQ